MRTVLWLLLSVSLLLQPGCFWRKGKPIEERVFDVYGTVKTISDEELVVNTKKGTELTFLFTPSSIRGGDFEEGTRVHTYYKKKGNSNHITMVVAKID